MKKVENKRGWGGRIKIETYWNVNRPESFYPPCVCPIKIETYWNVNKEVFADAVATSQLK